jgi:GGDEF domain-containing protein
VAELELLWLGLFLGVAAMALAYATGEAVMRGDAVNGWYALHIVILVFHQMVQRGYADRLFAGQEAAMARAIHLVAGTLLAAVSLLFARRVLPRALGNQRADRWALAVAAFGVILTAVYVVWPELAREPSVDLAQRAYYMLALLSVVILLWALRDVRLPYIGWYASAFVAGAAGVAIEAAAQRGWLPSEGWCAHYGMMAGAAVEILILTYALNFSARDLLRDPGERRDGARLDRWTGLLHAGELPGLLMSLSVRSLRMNTFGAVVMLRLANLEDLQRAHGSKVTESAMKACARVLREVCSPADVPLRLDDARFVVVLEQVQSRTEAQALAQRILELGLQHHPELPPLEQLQLHAAIAYIPQDLKGRPQTLIDRLDQVVCQIRRGSGTLIRSL